MTTNLCEQQLHAGVGKQADGGAVPVQVAAGKALVRRVEKGEQAPLLGHRQHARPLLGGGVDAGGVVRAGVQQEHRALGSGAQIRQHAVVVQPPGGGEVVAVGLDLEPRSLKHRAVVGPAGRGHQHHVRAGVVPLQKLGTHAQRACARQRLHRRVAALAQRGALRAKRQRRRGGAEGRHPCLAQVLLQRREWGVLLLGEGGHWPRVHG